MERRNLLVLGAGQALGMAGVSMVVFLGGIIGTDLAPAPVWSTLPASLMVVGVALFTVPASLFMRRFGRRPGFVGASLLAALAAAVAALAVAWSSFPLFCAAALLLGGNGAFIQQYRFAAAESVDPERVGRAVSVVLVGGIAAGFIGPELGRLGRDWLPAAPFAGSFLGLAALYLFSAALLLLLREPAPAVIGDGGEGGSLRHILRRPSFRVALLSAAVAYGVMSFVMTAAPLSMHGMHGLPLATTARIVQTHVAAMYLPSLFTGYLLKRPGWWWVMSLGLAALAGSVMLHFLGQRVVHYWVGMALLGIGWNFLFVGGTTLLTRSYRGAERYRAQAANDFTVFGTQALVSLSAGAVLFASGWRVLNLLSLVPVAALAAVLLAFRRRATREPGALGRD